MRAAHSLDAQEKQRSEGAYGDQIVSALEKPGI
jgi:hypothetical protein